MKAPVEPRDWRDRFTRQAEKDFRGSVRPVYRNSKANRRPEHIGSCLLLNIGAVPIVVTAAHILDQLTEEWSLYVAGPVGTSLVLIQGGVVKTTPKLEGHRTSDHYDTAFLATTRSCVKGTAGRRFPGCLPDLA